MQMASITCEHGRDSCMICLVRDLSQPAPNADDGARMRLARDNQLLAYERDARQETIDAVRAIHSSREIAVGNEPRRVCRGCGKFAPCPTIRAIGVGCD